MAVTDEFGDAAIVREIFANTDDEFGSGGASELFESLERRSGSAALHPGNGRLGGAHAICQFGLGQPGFGAEPVDELAECADARLVLVGASAALFRGFKRPSSGSSCCPQTDPQMKFPLLATSQCIGTS